MASYSFKQSANKESFYDTIKSSNKATWVSTRGYHQEYMEKDENIYASLSST